MSTVERDERPTAQLVDKVWCVPCDHTHIGTIPVTTFACADCGFGSWGASVAAAHAATFPNHIVHPVHHETVTQRTTGAQDD